MKIIVIIPVYNESASIERIIREIDSEYPDYDILVVNDASNDGSEIIAEETAIAAVVNLPYNLGIGGAVQTGFKYAREREYDIAYACFLLAHDPGRYFSTAYIESGAGLDDVDHNQPY